MTVLLELMRPPLPPPSEVWTLVKVVDGITVRTAPSTERFPWGAAETVIAAPPSAVLTHLTSFVETARHIPRLDHLRVLERREGEAVVYFLFDLPWPISNRDYTARYRWRASGEGLLLVIDDANERGPREGGAVRMPLVRALWQLDPVAGGKTLARHVALYDMAGRMPRSIREETAWRQPLETVRSVRRLVEAGP